MVNAEEYQKLLEPLKKPKKALDNMQTERMCEFYHKPRHLKEHCHWNLENPNNKLKDKKKVLMNEIFFWARRGTSGNHIKQGN
jgi:hypothetical protein